MNKLLSSQSKLVPMQQSQFLPPIFSTEKKNKPDFLVLIST
jgi:hypothetical protein